MADFSDLRLFSNPLFEFRQNFLCFGYVKNACSLAITLKSVLRTEVKRRDEGSEKGFSLIVMC